MTGHHAAEAVDELQVSTSSAIPSRGFRRRQGRHAPTRRRARRGVPWRRRCVTLATDRKCSPMNSVDTSTAPTATASPPVNIGVDEVEVGLGRPSLKALLRGARQGARQPRRRRRLPGRAAATPPGSGCSIIFGTGVTAARPGSAEGLQLSVYDIDEARADLIARGVDVSEPFHDVTGIFHHAGTEGRLDGAAPEHADYGSFASFADPDGNGWLLQEIKTRLPGR